MKEGTSAVLLQSGLDSEWWRLLSDGKTPHERRFGMPFDGPVMPQDHINLAQKSCQVYSLDMRYTGGESGKETC